MLFYFTDEETESRGEWGNFWKYQMSRCSSKDETSFAPLPGGLSIPGSHAPFAGRVSLGLASLSPVVAGEVSDARGLEFLSQIPPLPRKKLQFRSSFLWGVGCIWVQPWHLTSTQ